MMFHKSVWGNSATWVVVNDGRRPWSEYATGDLIEKIARTMIRENGGKWRERILKNRVSIFFFEVVGF